jgi:maltose O-acetyltransferase
LFRESSATASVGQGADFGSGCTVILRDYANLGEYIEIRCSHAVVTIGAHVMMGRHCTILGQNHKYLEEGYDGYEGRDVLIDDHAWLGDRVIVLPGVRIGKHAIVGTGAVVSKDVPDYAIAAGNPAVVKKYRKQCTPVNTQPTNEGQ